MTEPLFRDDAYLRACTARVLSVNERGGIVLDRTIFYPTGGGQPGDTGVLAWEGGEMPVYRFEIVLQGENETAFLDI